MSRIWLDIRVKIESLTRLFKANNLKRGIFAVRQGEYKGHFFVFVSETDDKYNFLVLPYNTTINVPKDQFEQGIENKIVDYIEKLPNNVHEICCAQYNEAKAKSDINRLKQSTTQSGVDSGECKN